MPARAPHSITSLASRVRFFWVLVRHPGLGLRFLRVLHTTWTRFFLPQYGPWRTERLRRVSMDLDAWFPFDAAWYPRYMGFTGLWIGSLGWLHRRFGRRAVPDIHAFLAGMESLFVEAHKVYANCQSTASAAAGAPGRSGAVPRWTPLRPKGTPLSIRLLDPNLHCFPSTHVMIVGFNAWRLAEILDRFKGPDEDFEAEKEFLLREASRVVESIIHVKQHSLGDIAPALVLLGALGCGPRREGMLDFLDGLFPHLPSGQGEAVRAFLKAAYTSLEDRREAGERTVPLLVGFLEDYDREIARLMEGLRLMVSDSLAAAGGEPEAPAGVDPGGAALTQA